MSTEKLLGLSSLAFGALLLAGAGCVGGTTTTSDTTTNTTTVAVDVEDEDEASDDDVVDTDTAIEIRRAVRRWRRQTRPARPVLKHPGEQRLGRRRILCGWCSRSH